MTLSSLRTNWSGGGRKSLMTFNFPIGSSVYLILLFIYLPSFPPESRAINANDTCTIGKPNGHNPIADTTNTIVSIFCITVLHIFGNDAVRIKKSVLRKGKGNVVLGAVFLILLLVPFKLDFFH